MRNVILVTFDSLRADHCGYGGYERDTTPTLDRMASEGIAYENAVAPSVPTGPSMFSTLTGSPGTIDSEDFSQDKWHKEFANRETLAGVLSEQGYDTAAFHANPYGSSYFGFDKGFDTFEDFVSKQELQTLTSSSTLNAYLASIKRLANSEGTSITWERLYEPVEEWLSTASEPYFLWVLLLDTHTPYLPPKGHRQWSDEGTLRQIYLQWKAQRRGWQVEDETSPLAGRLRNAYDDEIRYADRFLERLREDTRDDDPIVIAHGDHGEGFGEHGYLRHPPRLHEELVHVPLVVHNAGRTDTVEKPVSLRDLPATVTDLVDVESDLPGESVAEGGRDWVYTGIFDDGKPNVAVRTEDWKYHASDDGPRELYHLDEDPHEQENVLEQYPDVASQLDRLLDSQRLARTERRLIRERTTESQFTAER